LFHIAPYELIDPLHCPLKPKSFVFGDQWKRNKEQQYAQHERSSHPFRLLGKPEQARILPCPTAGESKPASSSGSYGGLHFTVVMGLTVAATSPPAHSGAEDSAATQWAVARIFRIHQISTAAGRLQDVLSLASTKP